MAIILFIYYYILTSLSTFLTRNDMYDMHGVNDMIYKWQTTEHKMAVCIPYELIKLHNMNNTYKYTTTQSIHQTICAHKYAISHIDVVRNEPIVHSFVIFCDIRLRHSWYSARYGVHSRPISMQIF